jgi:hypothetical protein
MDLECSAIHWHDSWHFRDLSSLWIDYSMDCAAILVLLIIALTIHGKNTIIK